MKLSWNVVELKLRSTFTTSHSASDFRSNILLELADDSGRIGRGEAAPYYGDTLLGMTADLDKLKAVLKRPKVARDPKMLEGLCSTVQSAFETATLDLLAQEQGVPLCALCGGNPERPVPTSFTLGQAEPAVIREKAEAARNWRIVKVKVGTPHDEENLRIIREVCPAATIRVDANGGWKTAAEAAERIAALAKFGLEFVEQPLPPGDIAAYRALRSKSPVPIYADESIRGVEDVHKHAGALDGIVVKLGKCGGIGPVLECIDAAADRGMKVMIGCMVESSVGVTAAAHIAGQCDHADLDGHLLIANDPYEGVTLADGALHLPNRPGLGVRRQ